jgi:hypothetical protein
MQLQLQNVLLFILIRHETQVTPVLFGKCKKNLEKSKNNGQEFASTATTTHQPQQRHNDTSLSFAGSYSLWAGWLLLFSIVFFLLAWLLAYFLATMFTTTTTTY